MGETFVVGTLALVFGFIGLLRLGVSILLAFAAYYDARSKDNKDALMWAMLIGFLGLIPGIIYLCIRNSGQNYVICPNCGLSHSWRAPICPRCGTPNQTPAYANPFAAQQAHRAKILLIIAIVLMVIFVLALISVFTIAVMNFGIYTDSSLFY